MRNALLTSLVLALPWAPGAHALEANQIFKIADPSIVVVTVSDKNGKEFAFGSGVLIGQRDFVTSCHVLKDAAKIAVKQGDVVRAGTLRYQDTARDLCQVQLDDAFPAGQPAAGHVMSKDLEVGQAVYAIGAPRGLERTISRGIVSGLRGAKDEARLIQTDAAISPGSSGGGLFDSEGRLVGIVTFGLVQESLNFAIPADWIGELPARNRDRLADAEPARSAASAGDAAAAPADSVSRGMPRTGDRWKYRLLDGRRVVGTVVVEIVDARGKVVNERITREGEKGFLAERSVVTGVDAAKVQDVVTLPGGYQLAELAPYVPLGQPMETEDSWHGLPVTLLLGGYGYGKQKFQADARVTGREKVKVPAGTFDTVRVQLTSEKSIASDIVRVICNYWYSTESMRTVKMSLEIKYTNKSFQSNSEIYELASFEPGAQ
jgi:S1-C subfamily serine protease